MRGRPITQFWSKVEFGDWLDCWLWTGPTNAKGYARVWTGDGVTGAHRFAYELLVGPIPDGLHLDHLCRTPPCVNPLHLEPVTPGENLLRGDTVNARNAAKTICPQGHPYDGDNLYVDSTGRRHCRSCRRASDRRHYWANPTRRARNR